MVVCVFFLVFFGSHMFVSPPTGKMERDGNAEIEADGGKRSD